MTAGASAAIESIKGLFTYPINKLIDMMNTLKNMGGL